MDERACKSVCGRMLMVFIFVITHRFFEKCFVFVSIFFCHFFFLPKTYISVLEFSFF